MAATIAISGTKDFGIGDVKADEAAEKVIITLADGTVTEVTNAIVAASCDTGNSVGVATRGGTVRFTTIALVPYDAVTIPGDEGTDGPTETEPEPEPEPVEPVMDDHDFTLNVSDNFPGSSDRPTLKDTNIAEHFEIVYGTGDTSTAVAAKKDTGDIYAMWSFNSISVNPNGQYAFSVNNIEFNADFGLASIFVRAIRNASPEKQFYGPDGGDATGSSHGGAGIWLAIADIDGQLTLRINVKSYENGTYKSNIFLVPVDGRNLTVADNGSVVTLIVNDKVAATIAISGTKDFGIDGVTAGEAAENVTITLADGTVAEVANAIVAASCDTGNSVGVATRGGTIKFTSISLKPYDTVAIPADET